MGLSMLLRFGVCAEQPTKVEIIFVQNNNTSTLFVFFISQIKGAGCKIILGRCSEWRVVCLFLPPKRVLGIVAIWVKMGGSGCTKRAVCKIDKKCLPLSLIFL